VSGPAVPRDPRQRLGLEGEDAAARLLENAGLRILERRFRCRFGEIDIIARDRNVLVFVEVRTRRGIGFGSPAESITPRKRQRMATVAQFFLSRRRLTDLPCRFDVVEVLRRPGAGLDLRHIVDAFRLWPSG
jgi:putative endonuclease